MKNSAAEIANSKFKIQHSDFSLPCYPRYQDSGVEWLGDVPEHWDSEKGKWLFLKMDRPVLPDDGVVTAFRDGQVTLRTNRRTDGFTNAIKEHGYQRILKGDLVIHAMDAFAGAIGVSDSDGKSTPVYSACVPRKANTVSPEFYAYLLRYMAHSGFITTLSKGIRERSTDFRFNDFGALELPLPPKPEQDRIVAFLDRKTAEIDILISKKQRQIELLDEQKAILINRAVTRGLNPNAKLKPSGIDWVGDIPAHWEVKRIGHFGKVGNGSTPSRSNPRYWDRSDYPWLNSGSVNRSVITEADQFVTNLALRECHLPLVKERSIVVAITGQGKTRGTAALLMIPATINQHLAYIEIQTPTALPEFVHLSLTSQYFQLRAISESGSTKGALTCQDVKEFKIALPPVDEQRVIISTSDHIQEELATLAAQFVSQIQSLKSLRSSLIAHAVTGRVKV